MRLLETSKAEGLDSVESATADHSRIFAFYFFFFFRMSTLGKNAQSTHLVGSHLTAMEFQLDVECGIYICGKLGYILEMATIRTTVHIDQALFKRAEELAQELQISRSRLYTLALESFFEEYEKLKLANAPGGVSIDELTPAKLDLFSDHPAGTWS